MISGRVASILVAVGIGVGTGVYVFQPLLKEYESETKGTWMRPGDEERFQKIKEAKEQLEEKKQ